MSKNAEFHADFESVENVLKKCTKKKSLAKTWRKNALFSLLTHVRQTCFAYNLFLVHFFTTFSTYSKSAWNSAFFDTFFDLKKKKKFKVILVLFSNFEAKCARNGSKNQKTYLINVSQISILHPSKFLYSLFSKKKSNSVYPYAHAKHMWKWFYRTLSIRGTNFIAHWAY